jgi:hypothetical protein
MSSYINTKKQGPELLKHLRMRLQELQNAYFLSETVLFIVLFTVCQLHTLLCLTVTNIANCL